MKASFVSGAFVLMAAATVNRIIGFIYQALIYRMIGPEGIGLFNLVYPVYVLIIVMATAGIPLGVSKLVSEEEARGNHRGSYQILGLAISILIITGCIFSVVSYLISPFLLKYVFINKMVYPVFLCLIPGIFIISVSSAFRGFFQGMMNMKPPAVGQIIEQLFRVCIGFSLATVLLPKGIQWAAGGLAAASVAGELAGLIVLTVIYFRQRPRHLAISLPGVSTCLEILQKLWDLCLPITMGRLAVTAMLSIDAILVPVMLKKTGYTTSMATALYGQLTGVVMTLLFVPSVITVSLATSLVPAISEAVAQNRMSLVKSRTIEALRVTVLAGIPFLAAYLVIPSQITGAVFGSWDSGKLLGILALGGMLAYIQQTTTGILQGLGHPAIPLKNLLIAGTFKIVAICALTVLPGSGIIGCGYAYDLFFLVTAGLNLLSLHRLSGYRLSAKNDIIKPLLAGVLTALAFRNIYQFCYLFSNSNPVSVVTALVLGFTCYLITIILLGSVKKSDYKRLPFIARIIGR
jgi:stage V sporulation protein B